MLNRYICDAIEDLRKMWETRNFSGFLGSVEEIQTLASRMEAKLSDCKEVKNLHDAYDNLKTEYDLRYKEYVDFVNEVNRGEADIPTPSFTKISKHDFKYNYPENL